MTPGPRGQNHALPPLPGPGFRRDLLPVGASDGLVSWAVQGGSQSLPGDPGSCGCILRGEAATASGPSPGAPLTLPPAQPGPPMRPRPRRACVLRRVGPAAQSTGGRRVEAAAAVPCSPATSQGGQETQRLGPVQGSGGRRLAVSRPPAAPPASTSAEAGPDSRGSPRDATC